MFKKRKPTNLDPALEARTAAQSHFRTLRLGTPFQPRIDALGLKQDWYNWAGYRVLKQHFALERPRINARPQSVCR